MATAWCMLFRSRKAQESERRRVLEDPPDHRPQAAAGSERIGTIIGVSVIVPAKWPVPPADELRSRSSAARSFGRNGCAKVFWMVRILKGGRQRPQWILWLGLLAATLDLTAFPAIAGDCPGNSNALGTFRTLVVDPREHPCVGTMQYQETLPLRDHELVLT